VADFLDGLAQGKAASPTFREALATEYVIDAVLKASKSRRWEKVKV
jgi:predicted dehydrogenase